jgi:flagellar biogenesis protein FliO
MAVWLLAQSEPVPSLVDGGFFRAVIGAVLVLGTLLLLAFLLRRGTLTLPGQRGVRTLSVETALSLGDRRSVAILNVEGRRLLIAMTPAQISLIGELTGSPSTFERAMERAAVSSPITSS